MSDRNKRSRELGLSLARVLLGVEDLHYGLWEAGAEPDFSALPAAQARYSDMLRAEISHSGTASPLRILEVGCGTGRFAKVLTDDGHIVHAVNPSSELNSEVRARLGHLPDNRFRLLEKAFENLEAGEFPGPYDIVLFSESFQYVPLAAALSLSVQRLANHGRIVLADFFKLDNHRDGGRGDRVMGGGHMLAEFYQSVEGAGLRVLRDDDLTARVLPNLVLMDRWLNKRLVPAAGLTGEYLREAHPWFTRVAKWVFRKKIARMQYKYLSGNRGSEAFRKYKSYRMLVLAR